MALDAAKAPQSVANFLQYVRDGSYNNSLFHRVIPGFVVQGGGYDGNYQSLPNHDPVQNESKNGLSNRRGLQHALHAALAHCSPQRLVAVYLMDLDGFKPINDVHGHDVGDDLLVAVGHRLQANVRHQTDLVARLGGDEFIIMARDLATPEQAEDLGRSLLRAFEHPFTLSQLRIKVGLTIGYALAPLDSDDPQGLLRYADAAMYAGKQRGKHSVQRIPATAALA